MNATQSWMFAVAVAGAVSVSSHAVSVKPSSYTFTPSTASKGTYMEAYKDAGSKQLIDGKYGLTKSFQNAADAEPWVGWLAPVSRTDLNGNGLDDGIEGFSVGIVFEFDQVQTFNSITVHTLQDHLNNIVVPNVTFLGSQDGTTWDTLGEVLTPKSAANNNQFHALTLDNFLADAKYLQIQLTVSDGGATPKGHWIFADEVSFTAVPEGGATMALLGFGFLGLAGLKRRFC